MQLPKTFLHTTYKKHREDVLLSREKSYLVATIPLVERERRRREGKKEIDTIKQRISEAYTRRADLRQEMLMQKDVCESNNMRDEDTRLSAEIVRLRLLLKQTTRAVFERLRDETAPETAAASKRQFVRACPADGCKGFVSLEWQCVVCSVHVCSKCHEIKKADEAHTCNPDMVKSATSIMKDTKPCPKCYARIFKIDGCDQIWCTECRTAFSWRTGNIETGVIHNPHYFEYLRRTGVQMPRDPGDVPCGGLPLAHQLHAHLATIRPWHRDLDALYDILQCLTHITAVEIYRFRIPQQAPEDANSDLRVLYILGEIQEDAWKRELQRREKERDKAMSMRFILDTLVAVGVDLMQRVMNTSVSEDLLMVVDEFEEMRTYINGCFSEHAKRFGCRVGGAT